MKKDKDHSHKPRDPEDRTIPMDARLRGDADPSANEPQSSGPVETGSAGEIARLAAEKEELMNTLVRRQADFDNYRKRMERERSEEGRRATGRVLKDLLPVLDSFERALRAHQNPDDEYRKGVELIYRHLWDTLSKLGLERIAAEGKHFDPHYHEAIDRVETQEHPDGSILQVVQEGYLFDGRVLRPSSVRVAVSPEGAGDKLSEEHFRIH